MYSRISFRNFLFTLAVLQADAFNPMSNNKPGLPDFKAATLDNVDKAEDVWASLTQMIQAKIDEQGADLTEEQKEEMIATAVAGSVVGTVVGSPLVVGAALGYAGSQMLQGENGEQAKKAIGNASKEMMTQASAAIDFTKKELENEKDLSKVSAKILMAVQDKATEFQKEMKVEKVPALMAERLKDEIMHTLDSEEFKSAPSRSFKAFMEFVQSDEVQQMKAQAAKSLKKGLESDEFKALQSSATSAVQKGIDTASSKIKKA